LVSDARLGHFIRLTPLPEGNGDQKGQHDATNVAGFGYLHDGDRLAQHVAHGAELHVV